MVAQVENVIAPELDPNLYSSVSTYIPLSLTSGKVFTGIQPSLKFTYNSTYFYNFSENVYKRGIEFLEPRLYLYSYLRTSARDLQPRFGFTLDSKLSAAPFETGLYGTSSSVRINLYLPGLIRNHGIRLRSEWQSQDVEAFYFQNHLSLPRGYAQRTFIRMDKYSADYVFPVLYPDLSVGSLFYLTRIRGNLFVDYMKGIEKYISESTTSQPEFPLAQGLELYADYHIFRFILELSSGARFTYFPHEKEFGIQMLFTVNLDRF